MKISSIVSMLLPALALAKHNDYHIYCGCDLKAKSLTPQEAESCDCYSKNNNGQSTGSAIYTGGDGTFSVPAYGGVTVRITCPSTSKSADGFVTHASYSKSSGALTCHFDAATEANGGQVHCTNSASKTRHLYINSITCSDFHVTGFWEPIQQIEADSETIKFYSGTVKTSTVSETQSWTTSVTDSVNAGIDVGPTAGASASTTTSQTCASTDSNTWTVSESWEWDQTFTEKQGKEIWQWNYYITDPFGSGAYKTNGTQYTLTGFVGSPPKCMPGWIAGNSTVYTNSQVCCTGGCLSTLSSSECQETDCTQQAEGPTDTLAPSSSPTSGSEAPSAAPSSSPTSTPTASPSTSPTASPTIAPTTATPSSSPTSGSEAPSAAPSSSPTSTPTASPSTSPTASPTIAPTTSTPSSSPTEASSAAPTSSPTSTPTALPSASPTASPTIAPTTATPTVAPTSSMPTSAPTATPETAAPSNNQHRRLRGNGN